MPTAPRRSSAARPTCRLRFPAPSLLDRCSPAISTDISRPSGTVLPSPSTLRQSCSSPRNLPRPSLAEPEAQTAHGTRRNGLPSTTERPAEIGGGDKSERRDAAASRSVKRPATIRSKSAPDHDTIAANRRRWSDTLAKPSLSRTIQERTPPCSPKSSFCCWNR
jgi:hypothetical protein